MPPRLKIPSRKLLQQAAPPLQTPYICHQCRNASLATTPAPPLDPTALGAAPPIARYPRTQPPSHKPPEFRKSQLHRQYQSLLRSSPLVVIFQHNNLKATEWMGIRRELAGALRRVDEEMVRSGKEVGGGGEVKMQVVQTGIFASALKVVEFWDADFSHNTTSSKLIPPTDPKTASSEPIIDDTKASSTTNDPAFTHGLSEQAWTTATKRNQNSNHGLEPILSGPLALLTIPSVSPAHLKAALSILSPSKDHGFPAPKRRTNPGYHEADVQNGVKKLILLAARVEGRVFDLEGTRWVGGIEGGVDGLRGRLVAMLQGFGGGVAGTLEAAGRSLYVAVEGRRGMLEEEEKGGGG